MRRLFAALSIAACFAAVSASPATAAPTAKSGSQYCQAGYTPRADAKAYGNLYLRGPGDASYSYFYIFGTTPQTRTNIGPGGYWRAYIDGDGGLDNGGTFGRCIFGS